MISGIAGRIYGIGIDLVKVSRMQGALLRWDERFRSKVFTAGEVAYCMRKKNPAPSFAARFAAKEAFVKALGIGIRRGVHWRNVEVKRGPLGRPVLRVNGPAEEICRKEGIAELHLSLTHDGDYAGAFVVLERSEGAGSLPAPEKTRAAIPPSPGMERKK